MDEFEKFYAKIWKQGETSMIITIPSNLVKYAGFNIGDEVIVMIKKKVKESSEDT